MNNNFNFNPQADLLRELENESDEDIFNELDYKKSLDRKSFISKLDNYSTIDKINEFRKDNNKYIGKTIAQVYLELIQNNKQKFEFNNNFKSSDFEVLNSKYSIYGYN